MPRPAHILLLAAAAAGGLALGASPAGSQQPEGDTVFTFTGRGWGHGVGMSQYGARGRALEGWSAARILKHYYRGTRLSAVRRRAVRVLLSTGRRGAAVWSPGPWRAIGVRPNGRRLTKLRPGAVHRLAVLPDGRLALRRSGRVVAVFAGPVRLQSSAAGGWVAWGPRRPEDARRYRGGLRAVPSGGTFDLVNVVGLEGYLKGVVPREMPATWGDDAFDALKAQAVAARTYALATISPGEVFDLFDDTRSQVYGGVAGEDPRTSRAVERTGGRVLTYDGQVITAFFFSTSGGRTEDVQHVFTSSPPRPYLVSVPDPYDRLSPYHVWPDPPTFSGERLGHLLGLDGPVAEITILSRGTSPRVREALVTTRSGQQTTLSGATLKARLGLRDTWFAVDERPAPVPP
jgi:stage II sporulation protein D